MGVIKIRPFFYTHKMVTVNWDVFQNFTKKRIPGSLHPNHPKNLRIAEVQIGDKKPEHVEERVNLEMQKGPHVPLGVGRILLQLRAFGRNKKTVLLVSTSRFCHAKKPG